MSILSLNWAIFDHWDVISMLSLMLVLEDHVLFTRPEPSVLLSLEREAIIWKYSLPLNMPGGISGMRIGQPWVFYRTYHTYLDWFAGSANEKKDVWRRKVFTFVMHSISGLLRTTTEMCLVHSFPVGTQHLTRGRVWVPRPKAHTKSSLSREPENTWNERGREHVY